ncbi:adenine phosphoribosyltransferase 5-like isoform X2 [Tripterygium wilfordii]|uniref:adenine phosphoribosyltransferase 5-like isoform X2 n=1 Tax=Tripterygium wilfordii TaxID=458696 RepID=UPI0018F7EF3B|nr:adenine phosphoribosyltransferase 5-like isoform X2 [Tripterygium wilfordii]
MHRDSAENRMYAAENGLNGDPRLEAIHQAIRVVPDFPKPGVEARGFMFGPSIALAIGAKFVPLRKPRKLPGKVISEAYELEYGTDCLEMHIDAVQPGERALVIDDVVATGGTLSAAIRLLERVGADVVECACVIGLREVKGQCRLNGKPVYILIEPRLVDNCC